MATTVPAATPQRVGPGAAMAFFAICGATYIINAADRLFFPPLLNPISAEFHFNLAQTGTLATIYTLGLGIGGVGTGYLLSHMSRKSTMVLGVLIYSFFTVAMVASTGFYDLLAYRTLTGVGEAVQNIAFVIAVGTFYTRSRTFALGLVQTAYGIGQFMGPRVAAQLAQTGDWRAPFWFFGIAGLIGAAMLLFVSRGFTEQKSTNKVLDDDSHMPEGLWNKNIICILLVGIVRAFPFLGFSALYVLYLTRELHYPAIVAAGCLSWFGIGSFLAPIAGLIADRTNQKVFQMIGLVAMALFGFLTFNVADTPFEQSVLAACVGISGSYVYVNGYSLSQRAVKNHLIPRAAGWYFASTTVPAAIAGVLLAQLVAAYGWTVAGTTLFSGILIVPLFISLFIDTRLLTGPTRRKSEGARLFT